MQQCAAYLAHCYDGVAGAPACGHGYDGKQVSVGLTFRIFLQESIDKAV